MSIHKKIGLLFVYQKTMNTSSFDPSIPYLNFSQCEKALYEHPHEERLILQEGKIAPPVAQKGFFSTVVSTLWSDPELEKKENRDIMQAIRRFVDEHKDFPEKENNLQLIDRHIMVSTPLSSKMLRDIYCQMTGKTKEEVSSDRSKYGKDKDDFTNLPDLERNHSKKENPSTLTGESRAELDGYGRIARSEAEYSHELIPLLDPEDKNRPNTLW